MWRLSLAESYDCDGAMISHRPCVSLGHDKAFGIHDAVSDMQSQRRKEGCLGDQLGLDRKSE